ncbi:MAG: phosphatase PAP2 family protein [Holosporales bacterium]|jgi:undecaprenyl-diphosphatase|nr:phosphatase PAP2 family protein [Holosporales bacterium]
MVDNLVYFALKMGQGDVIAFAIVLGILFHYRKEDFEQSACFVCFVIIFNTLLKNLFKIPLFPNLGPGYAFPSGHMHVATIFYGYFFYRAQNYTEKVIFATILGCIASAIVYCHFHDWYDIAGAIAFAFSEIAIYHILRKKYKTMPTPAIFILPVITAFYTLQLIYGAKDYNWMALYIFSGITVGRELCWISLTKWSQKCLALLLWTGIVTMIYLLNGIASIQLRIVFGQLRFFLFSIAIYFAIRMAANIIKSDGQGLPEK